jgi:hypothetical protein
VTRPKGHGAPQHPGFSLLRDIADRADKTKCGIEFEGLAEDKNKFKSEDDRLAAGSTYPALRLHRSLITEPTKSKEEYIALLFEHLDPARRSFQVVNIDNFEGLEIEVKRNHPPINPIDNVAPKSNDLKRPRSSIAAPIAPRAKPR